MYKQTNKLMLLLATLFLGLVASLPRGVHKLHFRDGPIKDVIVVNLDRRPDRMKSMNIQLELVGWSNATRMAAFDGRALEEDYKNGLIKPSRPVNQKTRMNLQKIGNDGRIGWGGIGCTLSIYFIN